MSDPDQNSGEIPKITIRKVTVPEPAPEPASESRTPLSLRGETTLLRRAQAQPAPAMHEGGAPPVISGSRIAQMIKTRTQGGNGPTTLGVSWLNGHFQAVAIVRGEVAGTYGSMLPVEDFHNLADHIQKAAKHTGFDGTAVSLVFAHPRMIQQVIDVPPIKDAALKAYVQRQINQFKTFEEPAAWAAQPAAFTKSKQGLLVHAFPKALVEQTQRGLEKTNLRLRNVTPVSALLEDLLSRLDLDDDQPVLIAAETAQLVSMVLARPGGQVFLARSVVGGWTQGASRIAVDLKRTILFANQQCGIRVNALWLVGAATPDQLAELVAETQLPVSTTPFEFGPTFWATEAARWTAERGPNLITREEQAAPKRRTLFKITAFAVAILAVASLFSSFLLRRMVGIEAEANRRLVAIEAEAQGRHVALQRLHSEVERQKNTVNQLRDDRMTPVPAWFLGYLSEICPPALAVTETRIRREDNLWKFNVTGRLQPSTNYASGSIFGDAVNSLTNQLAEGPFHALLTRTTATIVPVEAAPQPPAPGQNPSLAWMRRHMNRMARPSPTPTFSIEGVMQ